MGRLTEMFRGAVQEVREIERRFRPWSGEMTKDYVDGFNAGVAAMLERIKPLREEVEYFERSEAVMLASRDEIIAALTYNLEQYLTLKSILDCEREPSRVEGVVIEMLKMCLRGEKMKKVTV